MVITRQRFVRDFLTFIIIIFQFLSNISDPQYTSEHSNEDSPTVQLPQLELVDRTNQTLATLADSTISQLTDQYPQIDNDAMYMEAPREVFPSMIKVRRLNDL